MEKVKTRKSLRGVFTVILPYGLAFGLAFATFGCTGGEEKETNGTDYSNTIENETDKTDSPNIIIEPIVACEPTGSKGRVLVYNTEDKDDNDRPQHSYLRIFDDLHTILEDYGYDVDIKERIDTPTITSELLSNYDELWFMSTKREEDVPGVLTQSEIDAVLDFSASGRGLLICAEHRGVTAYDYTDEANQISIPLGVEFWGSYYYGRICALPDINPSFPLWNGVNTLKVFNSEPTFTVLDTTAVDVAATYRGKNMVAVRDDINRTIFETSWGRFDDYYINSCDNIQYAKNTADWLGNGSKSESYNIEWLPPIAGKTEFNQKSTIPIKFTVHNKSTGEFVHDETVLVEVYDEYGNLVQSFVYGEGDDSIRISDDEENYITNWNTKGSDAGKYTIILYFEGYCNQGVE